MKKLSPKIVKKLTEELSISEKTVRNHIGSLSKDYPHTTSNARAYLYAQKHNVNIFRLLGKEDKQTLPSKSGLVLISQNEVKSPQRVDKTRKLPTRPGSIESLKSKIPKITKKILNPNTFIGAFILLVIGVVLQRLFLSNPGVSIDTTVFPPTISSLYTPFPSLSPKPETSPKSDDLISINEGKSFTDIVSGITIGVNWAFSHSSDLTLTFPGESSEEFKDVKSGRVFPFKGKDGLNYVLTIVEVESSGIKVRIERA